MQHISKSFYNVPIITDINTIFERGKVNLIIGQSGSGKTVLTKCMIGLYEPEEGKLFYNGRQFNGLKVKQKREIWKEIGMLFQGGALFDSLTVEQNIGFPLRMFTNRTDTDIRNAVNGCLEVVKLKDTNSLFPAELSGGMKKRVAIARAIAMKPKYLFCDEPNSGLDPITSIVIDKLIQEITYKFNITTVVITHDMNSVMGIGDNINFIYNGKLLWKGDRRSFIRTENKEVNDFAFATEFMKKLKSKMLED